MRRSSHPFIFTSTNAIADRDQQQQGEYPNMFVSQRPPFRAASTTTDQYHRTESIWRIIIDAISLIIRKYSMTLNDVRAMFVLLSAHRHRHLALHRQAVHTWLLLLGHEHPVPVQGQYDTDLCSGDSLHRSADHLGNARMFPQEASFHVGFQMWVTEFCKRFYFQRYPKQAAVTRLELCGTRTANVSPFLRNLYVLTGKTGRVSRHRLSYLNRLVIFFYGYLATWLLTEISKNFVGGFRPHFLAVCRPTFDCSAVTSLSQFNKYLQYGIDYTCLNTDDTAVREAR